MLKKSISKKKNLNESALTNPKFSNIISYNATKPLLSENLMRLKVMKNHKN